MSEIFPVNSLIYTIYPITIIIGLFIFNIIIYYRARNSGSELGTETKPIPPQHGFLKLLPLFIIFGFLLETPYIYTLIGYFKILNAEILIDHNVQYTFLTLMYTTIFLQAAAVLIALNSLNKGKKISQAIAFGILGIILTESLAIGGLLLIFTELNK